MQRLSARMLIGRASQVSGRLLTLLVVLLCIAEVAAFKARMLIWKAMRADYAEDVEDREVTESTNCSVRNSSRKRALCRSRVPVSQSIAVAAFFGWRCPTDQTKVPFPHLPHPALGQSLTPSLAAARCTYKRPSANGCRNLKSVVSAAILYPIS
jgi:hypothetical protein